MNIGEEISLKHVSVVLFHWIKLLYFLGSEIK